MTKMRNNILIFSYAPQGGPSVLGRLESVVRAWAAGRGEDVRAVSVQRREGHTTPTLTPTATPTFSRVWLVSPGITNLDHILLHRKYEVIPYSHYLFLIIRFPVLLMTQSINSVIQYFTEKKVDIKPTL